MRRERRLTDTAYNAMLARCRAPVALDFDPEWEVQKHRAIFNMSLNGKGNLRDNHEEWRRIKRGGGYLCGLKTPR